jgi:hypothetical protein
MILTKIYSRDNIHDILAIPPPLYGCEIWTLKQRVTRKLQTAEMKFMKRTVGYNLLYHKRKEDVLKELKS